MTNRYTNNVSGSDSNDGLTELTPKQNLHSHTATNGDTFYVAGTSSMYNRNGAEFVLDVRTLSGITITNWGAHPTITHTNGTGASGRAIGIAAGGSAMNIIQNIDFIDTTFSAIGSIGATGANLSVIGCNLLRCGVSQDSTLGAGISVGITNYIESLIVKDTSIISTGRGNIFANVTNELISGNNILRHPGLAAPEDNTGNNIQSAGTPDFFHVYKCVLDHSQKDAKQCVNQSGSTTGLALIEDNEFYGPLGPSVASFKTIYIEQPVQILRNKILTGCFAMQIKGGGEIISNAIWINGPGALGSNQGPIHSENDLATLTEIYHNTIVLLADGSGAHSAISIYDGEDGIVKNNIIDGFAVGIRRHLTAVTESHNCIRGASDEVTDHNLNPIATGTGTITTDPTLDYNLVPSLRSPCLGTGTPLSDYLDISGEPFSNPPTMGCKEVRRRL